MADLKYLLEKPSMSEYKHVYEVYIAASPERVWQALTDSEQEGVRDQAATSTVVRRDPSGSRR